MNDTAEQPVFAEVSVRTKAFTASTNGGRLHWHTSSTYCGWCNGDYRERCIEKCFFDRGEPHQHVYTYLRTSDPKQARNGRRQLARLEKHLAGKNGSAIGVWGDHALSVKVPTWQGGLETLFATAAQDPYGDKRVVAVDVRRFTRNIPQGREYAQRAKALGLTFETTRRHYRDTKRGWQDFGKAVYAGFLDNQKRSAGTKRSHEKTMLLPGWRGRMWPGYQRRDGVIQPNPSWFNTFSYIQGLAPYATIENVLEDIWLSPAWLGEVMRKSASERLRVLRSIYNDPRYVGWKRVTGNQAKRLVGYEVIVSGGWQAVFPWDFWVQLQLLFPSKKQRSLIKSEEAYLDGKLRCGECGRLMRPTGLRLADLNSGEELANLLAYACPPRHRNFSRNHPYCITRTVVYAEEVHQQLANVFHQLATARGRTPTLGEDWQTTPEEKRRAFITTHLKQAVVWSDGVLSRASTSPKSPKSPTSTLTSKTTSGLPWRQEASDVQTGI